MDDKDMSRMISLAEYAQIHGKAPNSIRAMASRGRFQTAKKDGRNWIIDASEPYPQHSLTRRYKSNAETPTHLLPATELTIYSRAIERYPHLADLCNAKSFCKSLVLLAAVPTITPAEYWEIASIANSYKGYLKFTSIIKSDNK